ncbi:MAG: FAD-dependent oxidoreductase [Geminicoccaceae bacterium]|nr:MAG: FAD-dependent oxidoreductase [Geminicoccaceae bacterium]
MTSTTDRGCRVAGTHRYPHVFRPLQVGATRLQNRVFVPAHTTNFGADNRPTDRHLAYHRERAQGGAGLIIFEGVRVHPSSLGRGPAVNGYERAALPMFKALADTVHAEGVPLFGQILHTGRHTDGNYSRMAAWAPSPIPWSATAPPPHPMTEAEIEAVIVAHVEVALNLLEAGFDGIELQLAHGHLLQQFLSPLSNVRDDAYGGSFENRLRFAADTLARVRGAIGDGVTLGIRVSGDEFAPGGLTIDDMALVVVALAERTRIDFVNVSHSAYLGAYSISTQMADMAFDPELFRPLPRRIASALAVLPKPPVVMAVCRFASIGEAEAELALGQVDMVGMSRGHMAEAALTRHAAEGREDESRPCIACNQGCAGFSALNLGITCLTNPRTGRERQWPLPAPLPAAERRRVLVVGGGPGGMEAAATAAAFGHEVTLMEQSDRLGGMLRWTPKLRGREAFGRLLDYQTRALERHGVDVRLASRADASAVMAADAAVVIVATGAMPRATRFVEGEGLTLQAALTLGDALGQRVVVQDTLGTGAVIGVVEHLRALGHDVHLVAPTGTPAWTVSLYSSFALFKRLRDAGIRLHRFARIEAWDGRTVTLVCTDTGVRSEITAVDAVIAPDHALPDDALARALAASGSNARIMAIGDAQAARTALEAIFEGHGAARDVAPATARAFPEMLDHSSPPPDHPRVYDTMGGRAGVRDGPCAT